MPIKKPKLPDFDTIYRTYYPMVHHVCSRVLGCQDGADDATQDTFLLVHRKLHTFRGNSLLKTWIYRVAWNCALMHKRRGGMAFKGEVELGALVYKDDEVEIYGETVDPRSLGEGDGVQRLKAEEVERAIAGLPTGYRRALTLHDVEGYTHPEVAEMMGITVGATKSQLHKARAKVRAELGGHQ